MASTLVFLFVRRVLGLVNLGPKPDDKDVEIAVQRHQLAVLHRQVARPQYAPTDRLVLPGCCLGSAGRAFSGHAGDAVALASGRTTSMGPIVVSSVSREASILRPWNWSCGWHARNPAGVACGAVAGAPSSG